MFAAYNDSFPVDAVVDDQDSALVYVGDWSPRKWPTYYGYNNTISQCENNPWCTATMTFKGTRAAIYGFLWLLSDDVQPDVYPTATYTINGTVVLQTKEYPPLNIHDPEGSVRLFLSDQLPLGTHTLSVNISGASDPESVWYMLDWMEYNATSAAAPVSTIPPPSTPALARVPRLPRGLIAAYGAGSVLCFLSFVFLGAVLWRRRRYSRMAIERAAGHDKGPLTEPLDLLDQPEQAESTAVETSAQGTSTEPVGDQGPSSRDASYPIINRRAPAGAAFSASGPPVIGEKGTVNSKGKGRLVLAYDSAGATDTLPDYAP